MAHFEINSIIRGAQLSIVGVGRALQNPSLLTSSHYRQAGLAILAGIAIHLLLYIPVFAIKLSLRFISIFTEIGFEQDVVQGLSFIQHSVLQVPFFLMTLMSYVTPTLDQLFMDSLKWVDSTYVEKHQREERSKLRVMYYPNLKQYDNYISEKPGQDPSAGLKIFMNKFGRKAMISLGVYVLTFVPYIGPFVLPTASLYTFNKAVGWQPAVVIFGVGLLLPRSYLVSFLQSYFSSRSLMRELLMPYFSRIKYSSQQQKRWFKDRSGVLYGFAIAFFILLKVPLLGVLIYGLAEASTAFLITKITEPPPAPTLVEDFKQKDVRWVNKHEFLELPIGAVDKLNIKRLNSFTASNGTTQVEFEAKNLPGSFDR